jgi:type IV secretory pathway VirB10-like protein
MSFRPLVRIALVALPLAFAAAGCDVMDYLAENSPFDTKKKPIEGDRKAVFPGGVPGIEYNQPPPQPTNSNIPITAAPPPQEQPVETPQNARQQQQARPARAVQRQAPNAPGDDPWSDARPRPRSPGDDPWAESRPVR